MIKGTKEQFDKSIKHSAEFYRNTLPSIFMQEENYTDEDFIIDILSTGSKSSKDQEYFREMINKYNIVGPLMFDIKTRKINNTYNRTTYTYDLLFCFNDGINYNYYNKEETLNIITESERKEKLEALV